MEKSSIKKAILPLMFFGIIGLIGNNISVVKKQNKMETQLLEAKVIVSPTPTPTVELISGKASYYDNSYCEEHNPGCITASGEKFDENALTFACGEDIPLGIKAKFYYTGKANEIRSVEAVCNDRGAFGEKYDRLVDLSKATFEKLAPLSHGVINIQMEVLE